MQYKLDEEKLTNIANYPALTYFKLGDKAKNLVIFVTGGYNLARVAYGMPSLAKSDFLAYWFQKKGYSFLGLSYPLDHETFTETYPEFSILDWAKKIVSAAKLEIKNNNLPKTFIMLGWSMAGKSISQVNKIAKSSDLTCIYVSLASSPPLNGLISANFFDELIKKPTKKGLSSKAPLIPWFLLQLHEQNELNDRVIIDDDIYINSMLGDLSINLHSTNMRFNNGIFEGDVAATLSDTNAMDYASFPMTGLIYGDSRLDYLNTLFNQFDWSPMLSRAIYNQLTKNMPIDSLSPQQWECFMSLINNTPRLLSRQIKGSHLFFLGKKGAKKTVLHVESLLKCITKIRKIDSPDDMVAFSKKFVRPTDQSA